MIEVDGRKRPWREGMTVADLLAEMENGDRYAVVRVNQAYISRPDFACRIIPDDADVYLIPLIAGG